MALPSIPIPHFTLKKSKYIKTPIVMRPFLVGEETILLQVKDSENEQDIIGAIKQVIQQCVVEPANFDVTRTPSFIMELMFLRLRQHSNGEIVDLDYRCKNEVEGKECNTEFQVKLDLRESDIETPEGHTNMFEVGGNIGIELRYPDLAMAEGMENGNDWTETIATSINSIYSGDNVWLASDHTKEELMTFAKDISGKVRQEIQKNFFSRIPAVTSHLNAKCPKCNVVHEVTLNGLKDHFG